MKGWFLALALSLALTACGSRTAPDNTPVPPTESVTTAPETTPADGGIRPPAEPTTGDASPDPTQTPTGDADYAAREDGMVTQSPTQRRDGALADDLQDAAQGTADAARDVGSGLINGAERAADGLMDGAERVADGLRRDADAAGRTAVH